MIVKSRPEVGLHLLFVFRQGAAHALEIRDNLLALIDLFKYPLTVVLDLIDVPLQLSNHASHLILVGCLFANLSLQDCLARLKLSHVTVNFVNFLLQMITLSIQLS